jgi:hypothetical protein
VFGQFGDELFADFLGEIHALLEREFLEVGGVINHFEIAAHERGWAITGNSRARGVA